MKNLAEKEIMEQIKAKSDDIAQALSEDKDVMITSDKNGIIIKAYKTERI
jgi:hypothetical protein